MRIIEIITDCGHADTLLGIAEQNQVIEKTHIALAEDDSRCTVRLLVQPEKQQAVMDAVQSVISNTENSRIVILPVEATIPREEKTDDEKLRSVTRSREELYAAIESGAKLDSNFIFMVVLSTLVAAIGLLEDNVAVVIGAMVIAPLLGPNIALAFATSLGDRQLMWKSFKTNISGLLTALILSVAIGLVWPLNFQSAELIARTDVGFDGVALALASGAAAVMSLATGVSSSLVGVMVAVALLPPTATLGLMLAAGNHDYAIGAALLLAVNIVCVNIAAKLAFLYKGVKPRTWLEKQKARQSMGLYIVVWAMLLVVLMAVLYLR